MATFKFIVYKHHRKADGTYNVKVRVTHKRVVRNLATCVTVDDRDVTRGMRIKNQKYVDMLDDMLRKCRQRCNERAFELGDMSVDDVARLVADIVAGKNETSSRADIDFIRYGMDYAEKVKTEGRKSTAELYVTSLNSLVKFLGRDTLSVNELTSTLIKNWMAFIKDGKAAKGIVNGTAECAYPRNVRTLLNAAKREFNDEELGIIRIPQSPFKNVKLVAAAARGVRALDVEVIRAIFALKPDALTPSAAFSLDMFKLSFLLVGMNAADLYACADYSNGRITYERAKVKGRRSDKGLISIKVEPEAAPLVEKYRDPDGERVFGFYRYLANADALTRKINGLGEQTGRHATGLKAVGEMVGAPNMICYNARHSWATIARNKCGVSRDDISLALNHSESRMAVTDTYLEKDWSLIDNANRKVIDFVLYKKILPVVV